MAAEREKKRERERERENCSENRWEELKSGRVQQNLTWFKITNTCMV